MSLDFTPEVIDISHYQDVNDWQKVYDFGIRGVINKVTEGIKYVDKTFAIRREPVKAHGLLYGAYHFLRPGSIEAQVEFFLRAIGNTKDLLLCLDHEDRHVPLSDAKLFLRLVKEKTGQSPVLYSGFLIKEQLGNKIDPELQQYRLWLAQYSTKPTWPKNWNVPWLWQFTGDGNGPGAHSIPGITPGNMDIDSYQGTIDQLRAEWTGSESQSPTIPQTPSQSQSTKPSKSSWFVTLLKWIFLGHS